MDDKNKFSLFINGVIFTQEELVELAEAKKNNRINIRPNVVDNKVYIIQAECLSDGMRKLHIEERHIDGYIIDCSDGIIRPAEDTWDGWIPVMSDMCIKLNSEYDYPFVSKKEAENVCLELKQKYDNYI